MSFARNEIENNTKGNCRKINQNFRPFNLKLLLKWFIIVQLIFDMAKSYKKSFYLITSLFFTFGLLTVLVDSLIPRLKEIFELSFFQAGMVQFAFFIAYGLISIPAGNLLHRIGYKKGIIWGLVIMGVGCLLFLPAASFRMFPLFMVGYFILASGMTVLQVAANPYVSVLGEPRTASSRLILSQAFNSLGTTIAPAIGAIFILSDSIKSSVDINGLNKQDFEVYMNAESSAVQMPFLVLAGCIILLALIVLKTDLPELLSTKIKGNYAEALKHSKLRLGAVGIFVYVGAEVTIGSYLVNYFMDMNLAEVIRENPFMSSIASIFHSDGLQNVDNKAIVAAFVTFYWGGAMVGRFVGSYLTKVYKPNNVLMVFAALAITFVLISISTVGILSLWTILAVGLFNSIMFPTIFTIAIEDLGHLRPQGSGVLCTAIAGGAFIPPLFGYFVDLSGFKIAFLVVIICYSYILYFGKASSKLPLPKNDN
ncbi:MAG: FHS family L-fucose permease-like MFS transporter [Vicingaceae bacterium]